MLHRFNNRATSQACQRIRVAQQIRDLTVFAQRFLKIKIKKEISRIKKAPNFRSIKFKKIFYFLFYRAGADSWFISRRSRIAKSNRVHVTKNGLTQKTLHFGRRGKKWKKLPFPCKLRLPESQTTTLSLHEERAHGPVFCAIQIHLS